MVKMENLSMFSEHFKAHIKRHLYYNLNIIFEYLWVFFII